MRNLPKENSIVFADVVMPNDWEFLKGLEHATNHKWQMKCWNNAGLKKNFLFNINRIGGYVVHGFYIFRNRKKYKEIVTWQQFYGIFYAYFCALFKVKKANKLVIMTFIFKEKSGFKGNIFKKIVSKALNSEYVDKAVVYTKAEIDHYVSIFGVRKDLFAPLPLGIQSRKVSGDPKEELPSEFLLAVGRSNRDYAFLFHAVKDLPYSVVLLTDMLEGDPEIPENVIWKNNIHGDEYLRILNKCRAVLIPLKDETISSGQLVMLQSMQYKKPIIITEASSINDYVKHGYNAIVSSKEPEAFKNSIITLLHDKDLYSQIVDNGYLEFRQKYSVQSLGKNVGNIISKMGY